MTSVTTPAARAAVYDRWVEQWGSTTHFTFAGEKSELAKGDEAWVRVSMRHTDSNQETLGPPGGRRFLRTGSVFLQIFIPVNTGLSDLDVLIQSARAIFEGVSFNGLRFFDAVARETGPDGKWESAVVECFFDYEETK